MPITWNQHLFLAVNAPLHASPAVVGFAEFSAEWVIWGAILLTPALWIWGDPRGRGRLLATVGGVSLAIGINQLLGMLWFEPRPFTIGLGHTLIHHAADNSFPSDHATFLWALGFSLVRVRVARRLGIVVAVIGLLVAWARIYVGVHYPIDMLASLVVGYVGSVASRILVTPMERWIAPPIDYLYERSLMRLHLSPVVFPRAGKSEAGPVASVR